MNTLLVTIAPSIPSSTEWIGGVCACLLLLFIALLSATERALFSLTPAQNERIAQGRGIINRTLKRWCGAQDSVVATVTIANLLLSVGAILLANAALQTWLCNEMSCTTSWGIRVAILLPLLLLFWELLPKLLALRCPLQTLRIVALPLRGIELLLTPLTWLLTQANRMAGKEGEGLRNAPSLEELSEAIEVTEASSDEEKRMLSELVDFAHTEVVEIMRPRVAMVALEVNATFTEVKEVILRSGFSRIPIYEESLDRIRGVLYVKTLLPHFSQGDDFEWQTLSRSAYFVHEHKKIGKLLEEFQNKKIHLAIVVDEYGSTLGLVTLEDILEEIVGEISDESDVEERFFERLNPTTYLFDGKTHLSELCKVLDLDDDYFEEQRGEAESIAGLMLEMRRDFLQQDEELVCQSLTLRVESLSGHRIERVRIPLNDSE